MNIEAIEQFVTLANTGKDPRASAGERACHKLALAIHEMGDQFNLDPDAANGAAEFVRVTAGQFSSWAEADQVRAWIEKAAVGPVERP